VSITITIGRQPSTGWARGQQQQQQQQQQQGQQQLSG
jgi:hypothetical protein